MTSGAVTLVFPDKFAADQAEKSRGEVEAVDLRGARPADAGRRSRSAARPTARPSARTARPSARRSASRATPPRPIARRASTRPGSTRSFAARRTCSAPRSRRSKPDVDPRPQGTARDRPAHPERGGARARGAGPQDRRRRDGRRPLPLHRERQGGDPVAHHRRRHRGRQEDDRGPGGRRDQHRARAGARDGRGRSGAGHRRAAASARAVRGWRGCSRRPSRGSCSSSAKLPGVGEKTAARLAFHILRASPEDAAALAAAIGEVRQKIRFCSICCDLTEADPCAICRDARRDGGAGLRGRAAPGRARHRAGGRLPRPLPRPARAAVARSTGSGPTICAWPSWSGAAATATPIPSGGHPGDQPQRRGGGDGRLPRQAAAPARGPGDPHRHRRPDGRRARVRRPG